MAINAYTGLMGSGKSYEVVSEVIIPAICLGRRVVTNVDGIDGEAIRQYCLKTKPDLKEEWLGEVVHCHNEDVFKENFFPYYDDKKNAVTDTFVQPGDLVAIDEAWRFWGTDCKIPKQHKSFFLEHRHFVHPQTHVACDLVLMIQDIGTLHRSVRAVLAFTYRTHKKVSLGMSSTYSVNMWEGPKMTKKALIGSWVRKYKKDIFPLYSSFKGGVQGKSVNVDKRQNIFRNPKLWAFAVGFVLLFSFSLTFAVKFFKGKGKQGDIASPQNAKPGSPSAGNSSSAAPSSALLSSKSKLEWSEVWRVVGRYTAKGQEWVIVANAAGRLRLESPSVFSNDGLVTVGTVDGERVSVFSGTLSGFGATPSNAPVVPLTASNSAAPAIVPFKP